MQSRRGLKAQWYPCFDTCVTFPSNQPARFKPEMDANVGGPVISSNHLRIFVPMPYGSCSFLAGGASSLPLWEGASSLPLLLLSCALARLPDSLLSLPDADSS